MSYNVWIPTTGNRNQATRPGKPETCIITWILNKIDSNKRRFSGRSKVLGADAVDDVDFTLQHERIALEKRGLLQLLPLYEFLADPL